MHVTCHVCHFSIRYDTRQETRKISGIFAKLSAGRGISASEAKVILLHRDGSPYLTAQHEYLRCTHAQVMYIKKVRKLPMYGTTLFHVHNSKACLPAAWACHSY